MSAPPIGRTGACRLVAGPSGAWTDRYASEKASRVLDVAATNFPNVRANKTQPFPTVRGTPTRAHSNRARWIDRRSPGQPLGPLVAILRRKPRRCTARFAHRYRFDALAVREPHQSEQSESRCLLACALGRANCIDCALAPAESTTGRSRTSFRGGRALARRSAGTTGGPAELPALPEPVVVRPPRDRHAVCGAAISQVADVPASRDVRRAIFASPGIRGCLARWASTPLTCSGMARRWDHACCPVERGGWSGGQSVLFRQPGHERGWVKLDDGWRGNFEITIAHRERGMVCSGTESASR